MRICLDQLGERARGRDFDMSEIHDGPSSATSFLQSGHAYCRPLTQAGSDSLYLC